MTDATISEKIIKLLAKPGKLSEVEQKSVVDMLKNDKAILQTIRAIKNAPNNMLKKLIQRIDDNKNRHELIGFLGRTKFDNKIDTDLIRNEILGLAERLWICLFNQKNIPQCSKNFVILLGGPGEYDSKDPALHDSTWKNFVVSIQVPLMKKNVTVDANDSLHFFVYEPAYKKRWESDVKSKIDFIQKDVEQVKKKAINYLDRIKQIAKANGATYHGIQSVSDFWSDLGRFNDNSISRVWYFGHGRNAFWFAIGHNATHDAVGPSPDLDAILDVVNVNFITDAVIKKFLAGSDKASEFYGCNTAVLAEAWCKKFYIQAQGASGTMDFAVVDQGTNSDESILLRLRKTVTWISYNISIEPNAVKVISK